MVLNKPIVGMAATPDGGGYWLVASDGGIFSYGDAQFYGSTGSMTLNKPVVGMAATPDGKGYWLVASDGGIFSYGDAQFYGSTGSIRSTSRSWAWRPRPSGNGYWLVASDGGIFSYGDAQLPREYGQPRAEQAGHRHDRRARAERGYFLVASDGGIFSFGSAPFFGSLGGLPLKHPIVAATAIPDGSGYWFTDTAGLVSNFGAAKYYGSAPSPLNRPIVGMADAPGNGSFVGGTYPSGSYGYDISVYQCSSFPTGDHQIGIVQVDGSSSGNTNPCLAQEAAWAGGGLNLYTYLTYGTSTTPEPGCNGDIVLQRRLPGRHRRVHRCAERGRRLHHHPVVARRRDGRRQLVEAISVRTRSSSRAPSTPSTRPRASPTSASTPARASGTPSWVTTAYVPYWMADYLASPSGPGSCADYQNWVTNHGAQLPDRPRSCSTTAPSTTRTTPASSFGHGPGGGSPPWRPLPSLTGRSPAGR